MKSLVRKIAFYAVSLFTLAQIFEGVEISGGLATYIIGAVALSLMFIVIKPVLNIITFPLNLATLGIFSFLMNAVILYFLTVLVSGISIKAFTFKGLYLAGFVVPELHVNTFFAFIVSSMTLSFFVGLLSWLIKK